MFESSKIFASCSNNGRSSNTAMEDSILMVTLFHDPSHTLRVQYFCAISVSDKDRIQCEYDMLM